MLDIRFIRENREPVAKNAKNKGYKVDIEKLLELDEQRRQLLKDIEAVRAERNELAAAAKSTKPTVANIEKGKKLKDKLADNEKKLEPVEAAYTTLLKAVPNMALDDVPVGASEAENIAGPAKGDKPKFDFEPQTHWQLAEERGLIDKERAAKVSGSRFAYIKGDLVKLQFAVIQFVIDTLTDEKKLAQIAKDANLKVSSKPFIPVLPPMMIRTEVFDAM